MHFTVVFYFCSAAKSNMTWVLKQCILVSRWRGNWRVLWSSSRTQKPELCVGLHFVLEYIFVCVHTLQNVCVGVIFSLSSLSSSVQPRRGGHFMVHHPEGFCERGYLWQGVFVGALECIHPLILLLTWALLCFSASFDNISSICNGVKCIANVCMEHTSSNLCGWETPAVEFGKLCSAHHDSSIWLNGLRDCTHTQNNTAHFFTTTVQADVLHILMCMHTPW